MKHHVLFSYWKTPDPARLVAQIYTLCGLYMSCFHRVGQERGVIQQGSWNLEKKQLFLSQKNIFVVFFCPALFHMVFVAIGSDIWRLRDTLLCVVCQTLGATSPALQDWVTGPIQPKVEGILARSVKLCWFVVYMTIVHRLRRCLISKLVNDACQTALPLIMNLFTWSQWLIAVNMDVLARGMFARAGS